MRRKEQIDRPVPVAVQSRQLSWLWGLGTAAVLTLALSALGLVGLIHLLKDRSQPEAPDDQVELASPLDPADDPVPLSQPPAAPARTQPAPTAPQNQVPAVAEPEKPDEADAAQAPARRAVRIVLGPPGAVEERKEEFQRRNRATEDELRLFLANAGEVGLGGAGARIFTSYVSLITPSRTGGNTKGAADCTVILQLRPDLGTLPLRDGPGCTLAPRAASELQVLSRKLRLYMNSVAPIGPDGSRPMSDLRERLLADLRGKKPEWLRAQAVPTLNQMLMGEDAASRRLLVDLLAAIPEKPATVALAQRAAFDLSPEVRRAAATALKGRNPEAWRPVLLGALNYPWPPPADFAAETLVHLKDLSAVSELITMLRKPAPGRPQITPDRQVLIREVVKINHLANCLLCHPPAVLGVEPVLGVDPVQSIPVQVSRSPGRTRALSQISIAGGGHDYGQRASSSGPSIPVLVRADISFLRQDFSVSFAGPAQQVAQQVAQLNPALGRAISRSRPPIRFDYVVRTRKVDGSEWKAWQAVEEKSYPQRESVLFALRELTGQDHGDTTDAWVRAFPLAEAEVRSVRLADQVVRAEAIQRGTLLLKCRDGVGIEYTRALTRSIPRLSGPAKEAARNALVNRLAKEPAAELRKWLGDPDSEVRCAAVRACAEKKDRELVPDLIKLLEAGEPTAREVLKKLTGQELPDARAWREWWDRVARADG